MKVLLSWIREFVDLDESAEAIGRKLSMRGLALEGLEPRGTDALLDFDVTANRPDCLSMAGIAREMAVAYGVPFREPAARLRAAASAAMASGRGVPAHHHRGAGPVRAATSARSPTWPWARRRRGWPTVSRPAASARSATSSTSPTTCCSSSAIRCTPSITRGSPARPSWCGAARTGERLTTLDGKPRTLASDMLVIADAEPGLRPLAASWAAPTPKCRTATTRIVFEAAWFKPQSVRATSRALGLAHRGVDALRARRGPHGAGACHGPRVRAAAADWRGRGSPAPFIDAYPRPYSAGHDLAAPSRGSPACSAWASRTTRCAASSTALGFGVAPDDGGWTVRVAGMARGRAPRRRPHRGSRPSSRLRAPACRRFPGVQQAPAASDPRIARDARARRLALASGFSEAISFAFIEARHAEPFLGGDVRRWRWPTRSRRSSP